MVKNFMEKIQNADGRPLLSRSPNALAEVAEAGLPSHRPLVHGGTLNQNCPSEQLQSPRNRNILLQA